MSAAEHLAKVGRDRAHETDGAFSVGDSRPKLTVRQREVLDTIRRFVSTQGCPPTWRQLAEALGIKSTTAISDHLKALTRKGYIQRATMKSRAIVVVGDVSNPSAALTMLGSGPAPVQAARPAELYGDAWMRVRFEVLKRDGYRCLCCGATAKETRLQVDHILAVCFGGTNDLGNLRTLCVECNIGKASSEGELSSTQRVRLRAVHGGRHG